jgi:capsular polysaccharide biosynthesis protein
LDCDALKAMVKEFKGNKYLVPGYGNKKIFVSRRNLGKVGPNSRSLINRHEVEDFFENLGYRIVHPENLSVSEQINIFSMADVVAGEAGSGLHNSIFMQNETTVVNLQSSRQEHLIQSSLRQINNGKCIYVWGESESDDWNSNFYISLDQLELMSHSISQVGSSSNRNG